MIGSGLERYDLIMQTFLPFPDFAASAAVLDGPRLGKQRVETLQILRALTVPDYGWQRHPAVRMWMGHVPALVRYGLAMTDEWLARGHADATRGSILEFAPEAESAMPMPPPWLGDEDFHRAHRSNLVQKDPVFYGPRFPGTADALPYIWPEPSAELVPAEVTGPRLWLARAQGGQGEKPDTAVVSLPALTPAGVPVRGKKARQLDALLNEANDGDPVALPLDGGLRFATGTLGPITGTADTLARTLVLSGEIRRTDFDYPALLQDPRLFFAVPLPAALRGGTRARSIHR
ncbi:MSMEG_6728 family protein [Arthrobacter crystallopoietes]|uniref:Uncharacterized protein n=1 Tax=Crystallibacter crystallopoietes TaxID=37928 RepID=A0A1H1A8N8_9MICC|nr:hypothetical protein SAMN04489742_0809 [Arthrobacter crystallopoietes]